MQLLERYKNNLGLTTCCLIAELHFSKDTSHPTEPHLSSDARLLKASQHALERLPGSLREPR